MQDDLEFLYIQKNSLFTKMLNKCIAYIIMKSWIDMGFLFHLIFRQDFVDNFW